MGTYPKYNLNNIFFFLLLFTVWFGKKAAELITRKAKRTDFRIKIMNEILIGIQVMKMYAWENSFAKVVNQIRK